MRRVSADLGCTWVWDVALETLWQPSVWKTAAPHLGESQWQMAASSSCWSPTAQYQLLLFLVFSHQMSAATDGSCV